MNNQNPPQPLFQTHLGGPTFFTRNGFFNASLLLLFTLLVFISFWVKFWSFRHCLCDDPTGFLSIEEIFPRSMSLNYLLLWLSLYVLSVVLEFSVFLFLAAKKLPQHDYFPLKIKLLGFSILHNLPGLLLILTLMAQDEYIRYYFAATLVSLPLLWIFKFAKYRTYSLYPRPLPIQSRWVKHFKYRLALYCLLYLGFLFSLGEFMILIITALVFGFIFYRQARR